MNTVKMKICMFIALLCKKEANSIFGIQWAAPFLQNKDDIYSIGYVGSW